MKRLRQNNDWGGKRDDSYAPLNPQRLTAIYSPSFQRISHPVTSKRRSSCDNSNTQTLGNEAISICLNIHIFKLSFYKPQLFRWRVDFKLVSWRTCELSKSFDFGESLRNSHGRMKENKMFSIQNRKILHGLGCTEKYDGVLGKLELPKKVRNSWLINFESNLLQ